MNNPQKEIKRNKATIILGDRNTSAISATATGETLAVEITFNAGREMCVEGLQILFNGSIESCLASVYDTMRNRNLIYGNTQLGTVGYKRGTVLLQPYLKIQPMILLTGQSIQLKITNNTGSSIPAGDLGFTLFGYQFV